MRNRALSNQKWMFITIKSTVSLKISQGLRKMTRINWQMNDYILLQFNLLFIKAVLHKLVSFIKSG